MAKGTQCTKQSVTFSIRLHNGVTSVSLRKNIVSLWILLLEKDVNDWRSELNEFIYDCVSDWGSATAKGFSDFILQKMIREFLEKEDYRDYLKIYKNL
jgi:hypothetical protein